MSKLKHFVVKKGDQLSFTITFTRPLPINSMEWGVKKEYTDEVYTILKTLNKKDRKVIFVGDSYLTGYNPNGYITSWGKIVANELALSNYKIQAYNGAGFTREDTKTFAQLLNELSSDSTVTDIILCGGYNDIYATSNDIDAGISNFANIARSKFKNANIKVSMVGWSKLSDEQTYLSNVINYYKSGCTRYGLTYMNEVTNSIHNDNLISSDNIHPTEQGQQAIASNVIKYLPDSYTGDIIKISDNKYQFTLTNADTNKLDYYNYPYDIRYIAGNTAKTVLSGKIFIKETVFEAVNG